MDSFYRYKNKLNKNNIDPFDEEWDDGKKYIKTNNLKELEKYIDIPLMVIKCHQIPGIEFIKIIEIEHKLNELKDHIKISIKSIDIDVISINGKKKSFESYRITNKKTINYFIKNAEYFKQLYNNTIKNINEI